MTINLVVRLHLGPRHGAVLVVDPGAMPLRVDPEHDRENEIRDEHFLDEVVGTLIWNERERVYGRGTVL